MKIKIFHANMNGHTLPLDGKDKPLPLESALNEFIEGREVVCITDTSYGLMVLYK